MIRRRIDLGLESVKTFDGRYLPQREALECVLGASVGVVANLGHPRNHAALPVKLLEYVAMGIPVVTSDLAAIRDYFTEDEVWFYPPGDSEALATGLIEVATTRSASASASAHSNGTEPTVRVPRQTATWTYWTPSSQAAVAGNDLRPNAEPSTSARSTNAHVAAVGRRAFPGEPAASRKPHSRRLLAADKNG